MAIFLRVWLFGGTAAGYSHYVKWDLLREALKTQFPYFVGSKATPWEVRSLREASHDKGAILDDFGFMNQHTDSNSTGIVVPHPSRGQLVRHREVLAFRRARHQQNGQSQQALLDNAH